MKYITLAIMLLLSVLLFSCRTEREELFDYKEMAFTDLFTYFLEISDTIVEEEVVKMLEDSIARFHPERDNERYFPQNEYRLFNEEYRTNNDEIVKLGNSLTLFIPEEYDYGHYKERNLYEIEIKQNGAFKIEDKLFNDDYLITNELSHFLLNPLDEDDLPEKRQIRIDTLGVQTQSKGYFILYANVIPDSLRNKVSLYTLKKGIIKILAAYESIRNALALKYWQQSYQSLGLEKQAVIKELVPVFVIIYFDDKPLAILPQMPPLNEADKLPEIVDDIE